MEGRIELRICLYFKRISHHFPSFLYMSPLSTLNSHAILSIKTHTTGNMECSANEEASEDERRDEG